MLSKERRGLNLIYLTVFITLTVWLGSRIFYSEYFVEWQKYPAKAASLSAIILMCWSVILSARYRWVENVFGGLDKVYKAHRRIGKLAFGLILLHPLFLAARFLPSIGGFFQNLWFLPNTSQYILGYNVGILTLIPMTVLVILSVYIKLPYHIWKKTHEYFGLVILLAAIHILLVDRDVARYPLLGIIVYSFLIVAIWSVIYFQYIYPIFGPKYKYIVDDVELVDKNVEITLVPTKKGMDFKPGQFIYIKFYNNNITPEVHPYSIAYAPEEDGTIKLGIKQLGDHTKTLTSLQVGDEAVLWGPYGKFSDKFLVTDKECVFVAGGIGVTPFLGMWDYKLANPMTHPKVKFFYVVNNKDEASFDNDIKHIAIKNQFSGQKRYEKHSHHYEVYEKDKNGYITVDYICQKCRSPKKALYFLCGPKPMMDSLIKQLKDKGVPNSNIITEDFDILRFPRRKTLLDYLKF